MRAIHVAMFSLALAMILFCVAGVFVYQNLDAQTEQERLNAQSAEMEIALMIPLPHTPAMIQATCLYGLIFVVVGILAGVASAFEPLPKSAFGKPRLVRISAR